MYKQTKDNFGNLAASVLKIADNGLMISIPPDLANTDYQAYLAWVAEGNEAEEVEQ